MNQFAFLSTRVGQLYRTAYLPVQVPSHGSAGSALDEQNESVAKPAKLSYDFWTLLWFSMDDSTL